MSGVENVEGALALQGADTPAYTPSTEYVGMSYYFLVITNTLEQGEYAQPISPSRRRP